MKLTKCCDAEVKFGMVDDSVGHGIHEETECSNCGELFPEVYDDEEEKELKMEVTIPQEFVEECREYGLTDEETRTVFMKAIEYGVSCALDDIEFLAESCLPE